MTRGTNMILGIRDGTVTIAFVPQDERLGLIVVHVCVLLR